MDFLNSLKQTWGALSAAQRVGTLFGLLASAGLLAAISYFGNRVEYRSLAVGEASKIGEIANVLETAGIKPRVSGNGLQVPVDRFDEAVLTIARQGLNTEGVGFELLDKSTNAFTTSLLEKVNVQRAVAGELERILRGYPGIASARVLISQDKDGWRTSEKDGTASVSLTLRGGASLRTGDVAAIQACVANAWASLRPEAVAVMANGKKLTKDNVDGPDKQFAVANNQLMTQLEYEDQLAKRAQDALDRAQGPGKTHVTVNADLSFDTRSEKSRIIDKENSALKHEETRESTKSNRDSNSGGATGVSANTPGDGKSATPGAGEPPPDVDKTSTNEYENSYNDKVTEKRGFELKRLSIALFVDQSLKTRLNELEKVVKAAVGFDEKRNDQFSGTAEADFAKPPDETTNPQPVGSSNIPELISTGGRIGALLALATLFLFLVKRANSGRSFVAFPSAVAGVPGRAGAGAGAGAAATMAMGDVAVGTDRSPEEIARVTVAKSAAVAASSDPAAAGRVVRSWLDEKRAK